MPREGGAHRHHQAFQLAHNVAAPAKLARAIGEGVMQEGLRRASPRHREHVVERGGAELWIQWHRERRIL